MIKELRIRNFALIDNLGISFEPGLNILTGETGAGKTILINALNLVLGGRASADYIRDGAESAEVEASFFIESDHLIYSKLQDAGFDLYPAEDIIIRRIIFRSERANKCYLNNHLIPLSLLVNIGDWLIDIHGQHEHQFLLNPAYHLDILDRFAKLQSEINAVETAYNEYIMTRQGLEETIKRKEEAESEKILLLARLEDIERANLIEGEEETLLQDRSRLVHAVRIQELILGIDSELYQSEGSVYEKMGEIITKIKELCILDPIFKEIFETMNSILIQTGDISHQIMDYISKEDFSPNHLEEIEQRLDEISRLKKKYKLNFTDLLSYKEELNQRLQDIDEFEDRINGLSSELKEKWELLSGKAYKLSEKRRHSARIIEKEVEDHLKSLNINNARFSIKFFNPPMQENNPPRHLSAKGWDDIEFVFSANIGEEPKSLAKIGSGGEISRIMLAFKASLAEADQVLTLVFDEIDTGIGGKTAIAVGQKMKSLAKKCQIICITHLPQIASNANTHYLVSKDVKEGRTITNVIRLSRDSQIEELAKMIAGDIKSGIAIKTAEEMLKMSKG